MFLRQSTSQAVQFGPMLDDTDFKTAETGLTIVMVTHEEDMAAYADRLIWMVDGRIADDRPTTGGTRHAG